MFSRFRVVALLAMLSAVAFIRAQSGDRWPAHHTPTAVDSIRLEHPAPGSAVRVAVADRSAPATPAPFPFEVIALGAIIGATSSSGRKGRGQMIIDSVLHVARKNDKGVMETKVIPAGLLLDDVDPDINLTDDEIDEFTARRVIRYATPDEIERAEQTKANREAGKVQAAGAVEADAIAARHQSERQQVIADFERQKNEALAKLDEQAEKERADAAQKTAEDAQDKAASTKTRTSAAGAQSAAASTPEARARAAGGTPTPTASASPDVGAESKAPKSK